MEENEGTNRIKCFICNQWVKESMSKKETFYGSDESVCPTCYQKLLDRDNLDRETSKVMEKLNAKRIE